MKPWQPTSPRYGSSPARARASGAPSPRPHWRRVTASSPPRADRTPLADLVASAPERVSALQLDVTDADRIRAAVAEVLERHGRVDVLVNNAGRGAIGAAEETSDSELRDLMDLHFFGPAALTRAVLPQMRERGSGAIVQMSSMGGRFTFPGVGAYSATKFALEGWSEALAKEVERFGIRVLIVEPGAFRTSFNGPGALLLSKPIPAYDEQIEPLRTGMPDDDGKQPGDPAKAAAAILLALESEDPPLRLALGNDAVDAIVRRARRREGRTGGVGAGRPVCGIRLALGSRVTACTIPSSTSMIAATSVLSARRIRRTTVASGSAGSATTRPSNFAFASNASITSGRISEGVNEMSVAARHASSRAASTLNSRTVRPSRHHQWC